MASQRGRAREWGLRLGLLAVTLVLLAGLLEIGTRIFSSQPPALKYSRPGIGEYYRPGLLRAGSMWPRQAARYRYGSTATGSADPTDREKSLRAFVALR